MVTSAIDKNDGVSPEVLVFSLKNVSQILEVVLHDCAGGVHLCHTRVYVAITVQRHDERNPWVDALHLDARWVPLVSPDPVVVLALVQQALVDVDDAPLLAL